MRVLGDIPIRYARLTPHAEALVFEDTRLTWKAFNQRINRLANWLLSMGFKAGDTVSALAQNCHQYFELYYAAFKIGMINAPINYRLSPSEILHLINFSQSQILFVGAEYFEFVEENRDDMEYVRMLVSFDGPDPRGWRTTKPSWRNRHRRSQGSRWTKRRWQLSLIPAAPPDCPRGAMLTHRNFFTVIRTILIYGELSSSDVTLQVLLPST